MEIRVGSKIKFFYINYKGSHGERKAEVKEIFYGTTDYHPESQWLIRGYDLDKKQERIFAVNDMLSFKELKEWGDLR